MREETIAAFFTGQIGAEFLNAEALRSITQHDSIRSSIAVTDLDHSFCISREHIIKLCDAGIIEKLSEAALNAIAFALIATDQFEWDDDIISEVVYDWAAPEVNYPLTPPNLSINKDWLLGNTIPPAKPPLTKENCKGSIVTWRAKTKEV